MLDQVRRRKLSLPESGIEIALLDWGGSGPLALLHHATGYCAGVWGPVAEQLSHHYRVIAMDARGHGDSSKPVGADSYRWAHFGRDVVAVAEQLATEQGLLPDGAFDAINEAAFDACDEPVLEGEDPIEINPEAMEAITA